MLLPNLRHAARAFARQPGFALTVVVTLAVGIGANAAVFSAIDAVLFEPLPFPDGDRLVRVRQARVAETPIAPVRLEEWSRRSSAIQGLTGYYVEDVTDTTGDLPERVRRAVVAPRFLEVWGIAPALGRGFTDEEHRTGGPPAVLISDRYWRTRLGGDSGVLGASVRIEGRTYSIVGVMPASFLFSDRQVDMWWPYPVDGPALRDTPQNRDAQWYIGVGRLKPGVTPEQARTDLEVVQAQLAREHPDTDTNIAVRIVPYRDAVLGAFRGSLWLLYGAVSVLLLIACGNIAALLLSRAARRQHEVALRFTLGASRAAVAGQLLTETALLAFAGAAAGLLVASGASAAVRMLAPDLPRIEEIGIDARIFAYTTAAAIAVTLLCGLAPALRSVRGGSWLSGGGRTQVSGGHSAQWLLVGAQITLSVTLLAGAGLLLRSAHALSRVDPGFDASRVLAFRVSGSWAETTDRGRLTQRIAGTLDALRALPGVESAATAWSLPGVPRQYQVEFQPVPARPDAEAMMAEWRTASPEYFATLSIPVVSGSLCRGPGDGQATRELMVNRSFAARYLRREPAEGLQLRWEGGFETGRVVGVVADARELGMDRDPFPTVYACHSAPTPFPWFLLRTRGDAAGLAGTVRVKLEEIEPLRSVYDIALLEALIGDAYAQNRMRTVLLVLFAATALALACLGVYGTLSYVVSLRRREVGLRLALGALRTEVVRQLVAQGLRVVAAAAVCGLALSAAFTRVLAGMLYGVSPSDPVTLAGVVAIVLAVASLAALIPAARAALVEPMQVLREE
jgi:predicted permease